MDKPPFAIVKGGGGVPVSTASPSSVGVESPDLPPGAALSESEQKMWAYICDQLRAAGIDHLTGALSIVVVVKTYTRWLEAEQRLAEFSESNGGTYFTTTPNGYQQPHQYFYVAKNLKNDLLKWLPECCLTLPSLATVRQKTGAAGGQDDLFADMVAHGQSRPSVSGG